uniref:Cytochrome P450 2G1-like n=1 Tax=Sinocyclocheilus rhinocerous TaxID=307959 RepID=A0A673JSF0_9TELE
MEFSSSLVLVLVLAVLMLVWWKRNASGLSLPPGPLALPLIGNLPIMDNLMEFIVNFDTSYMFAGLAISNGDRWRQLRRFTLTTLRDFGMGRKRMEQWIQEESRHLLESFEETKSTPVDPAFFLSRAVSNVICSLVFGQRFDYEDKNFLHLLQIISRLVRFISSPQGQLYNVFPKLMQLLPGRHHAMFKEIEVIKAFVLKKIKEHEQNLDFGDQKDFIDCFLIKLKQEKHNPDTEFHKDNMLGTVLNLFIAGTETTSTTLRYALMLLIKHPHIQGMEIDQVIGQNRIPTMDDRKSLPFTDAVIHEVQRYLDIVPLNVPHYATRDISFRGYIIPKVRMNTYSGQLLLSWRLLDYIVVQWQLLQNAPKYFLIISCQCILLKLVILCKRSCVGESLARMELFLFIVSLLQKFSFSSPKGPDGVDTSPELSSFGNMPRFYDLIASPR